MKKIPVIHPFLLSLFPVVSLFAHNKEQLTLREGVVPALILFIAVCILFGAIRLVLKNSQKAGLLLSLYLLIIFSYGHIHEIIKNTPMGTGLGPNKILLPLTFITLVVGSYWIFRTKRGLFNFTKLLNIITGCLILIPLIEISVYKYKTRKLFQIDNRQEVVITGDSAEENNLPDIYYIIPDHYASQSSLAEFYHFDNSDFIAFLEDTGFYVAEDAKANYGSTAYSLASSLNMKHLTYLGEEVGEDLYDWGPLYSMVKDYKVWIFLKSQGYKFINLGSWWEPTRINKNADMNFNIMSLSDFSTILYETTLLYPLGKKLGLTGFLGDNRKLKWDRVLFKFKKLSEISGIKGPKFVIAHFIIPHPEHVFYEDGEFLPEEAAEERTEVEKYNMQIKFLNQKFKDLIKVLLEKSRIPPVIILQSDEGPFPERYAQDEINFNWDYATPEEYRKKFGILNAYYIPGMPQGNYYSRITPVNTFRLLFNCLFQTGYELLPDDTYAFQDRKHRYKFINITDHFEDR